MKEKFTRIELPAYVLTIFSITALLAIWELVSRSGLFNISLFPPPSVVSRTFVTMLLSGELVSDVLISLQRVIVGFVIGSAIGVLLGVLTGRVRLLAKTIGQLIQLFRPIPVIAFVPLAIVWFGLGEPSKYFLIMWGVFFPVWINTHLGVSSVDTVLVWAAKSLGATDRQIIYEVVLPNAVPFVVAGARNGIALAFICLVAAEMAGAFGGIGYRISVSHLVFRVDKMMVGLVMLGILGAATDALFAKGVLLLMPWYEASDQQST